MNAEKCISELRRIIADALLQTSSLATFYEPEFLEELAIARKRYPEMMRAVEDAHLCCAISLLYGLQETRRDTANFPQLLRLVRSGSNANAPDLLKGEELLSSAKARWKGVAILRNEIFGHRASAHSRKESFARAGLTPRILVDLARLYQDAVNHVALATEAPGWAPLMDAGPTWRRAIKLLGEPRD